MHDVSVSVVACFIVVVLHLSVECSCLNSVGHLLFSHFCTGCTYSLLNCIQLVMQGQLVFLNLLYHIHWLIFSDSILFVITMYRRCILCMCICVVIIQLFRLSYVNKRIVSYHLFC